MAGNQTQGAQRTPRDGEPAEPWHHRESQFVFEQLQTSRDGLADAEVRRRLDRYGPNRLPEYQPPGAFKRLLMQFHNVLIYVLLAAGVVTLLLQHWLDAAVILAVVVINALIGFIQEGKAEDALAAIRHMLSPRSLVIRAGQRRQVDAAELVPGDLVPLQAGDKVVADLRLVEARGLRIEEAALTGESVPVEKQPSTVPVEAPLADRTSMAYSGTLVVAGQGLGVVVATGARTELGRISALVAGVEQLTTPLLRQMAQFGRWLSAAVLLLALLTFGFGFWVRDYSAAEMFMAAVGLAVAAIPEGLPAIMTITLAIGVQRMAASRAIIRRLPAVETLGTLSVVCTDKTGTLTRNEMTVRSIVLAEDAVELSGTGYDPHGGLTLAGRDCRVDQHSGLQCALQAAVLCNDAGVQCREGQWTVQGDPMEAALLVAGIKAGMAPDEEHRRFPRTDLIPFDAAHKFMATLHHGHDGTHQVCVKGAPEALLARCQSQLQGGGSAPLDLPYWEARVQSLCEQGYRVLALALKRLPEPQLELNFSDLDQGLEMVGLLGLIDPPRPEAVQAVSQCLEAGIRVKMITGDHKATAMAIAAQVGLVNPRCALSGPELDALSDEQLRQRILEVDVFARVAPEHKLRLVEALQAQGKVVSMTGDGVNDAPALKRADVGVAMGCTGTEAAKDASEMVLTDDNFASIANAIREGRTVYDNLKKAILFILPTNGGEALVILGAILMGFEQLPLTPAQILWVNMITAVTLALALAFEPPEPGLMRRRPRNPREPVLNRHFLWRIAFVSLILMGGTFGLYLWDMGRGAGIEHARTLAVNTLVMFEIFYLFSARYIWAPVLNRRGLLGNPHALLAIAVLVVFQLLFTYLPALQQLFGTEGLEWQEWGLILLVASSVLWLVELEKALILRYGASRDTAPASPGGTPER